MDAALMVIDSIPPQNFCPELEGYIDFQTTKRLTYVFWKHAQLPVLHPRDVSDKIGRIKKWKEIISVNFSFLRHNLKGAIAYIFATCLGKKACNFFSEKICTPLVDATPFIVRTHDRGLLQKIRLIFPAILIPLITVAAEASCTASRSFFATKRGAPGTTLLSAYFIFDLHQIALESLSISHREFRNDTGSLLNLGDALKSTLFTAEELEKTQSDQVKSRVMKVMTIFNFCFSNIMCTKSFYNKSPFWINAAWFLMTEVTEQIATKYFLQFEPKAKASL